MKAVVLKIRSMEIKMNKTLPFNKTPYFSIYQYDAFAFGILQANPKTYAWIYSNFVQYALNSEDVWLQQRNAILKEYVYDSNTKMSPKVIFDGIRQSILNDYYVAGIYDEFYIPQKLVYKKSHLLHDYIIYGFNDQSQEFFSYGYVAAGGNYQICKEFTIRYSDFIESILHAQYVDYWTQYFYRVKINENLNWNFNRMRLCDELYQYLKQPVLLINEPMNGPSGICVWKDLSDRLKNISKGNFDSVLIQVKKVNEYVQLMLERLKFINDNDVEINNIVMRYIEFAEKSDMVYALSLKFFLTENSRILNRIIDILNNMFTEEYIILRELLNIYIEKHVQEVLQINS